MSRAEEQALKAYPSKKIMGVSGVLNYEARMGFIKGYEQAEQDLTDKAKFSSGWDGFFYGRGYNQAKQDTIERACQILYDWNKQMTEMFGAKAVLSCNQFTTDVDRFRKILELEEL